MSRLLGVIGGLGPFASAWFYRRLIELQKVTREQDYIDILLYSKPSIPDRTAFIADANNESPLGSLLEAARVLEKSGVSCITIPCVTAHFFYEPLQSKIKTPIINIVEETVRAVLQTGARKAGLLATNGTIRAELFQRRLKENGIATVTLPQKSQESVMNFIYKQAKMGSVRGGPLLRELSNELLKQGAETVILGCTELSLAGTEWHKGTYIDALEVLARAAVETVCK
jgi:aspartate racemase